MTVSTSTDRAGSTEQAKPAGAHEPLELTSFRDDIPAVRERSGRLVGVAAVAVVATGLAIVGAVEASRVAVGPGRVLACVLVVAWSAAAVFVAAQRPKEPLSWIMAGGALDSEGGHEVLELFRRLHASGQTILLVTHDDEVAEAGDRIVRMRDGRVVSDDDATVAAGTNA